jgi:hypothetical protein
MEVIPARNVMDAHAQDFMGNDELLLSILQTFTLLTCSLHAARNVSYLLSGYSSRTVCRSSLVRPINNAPAPRQTRLPPHKSHLLVWHL